MDKKVVRASYESCLNMTARLAAFATSTPFLKTYEVNERQDMLAANDLIEFCIHARRLIDNVGLYSIASETVVDVSSEKNLSIWKILGAIIHHDELEILRCATRLRMFKAKCESKSDEEYWERIMPELHKGTYSDPVSPIVLFKSDQIDRVMFNLENLLQVFSQQILPQAIEKAAVEGLYLDDREFEDVDFSEKALQVLSQLRGVN